MPQLKKDPLLIGAFLFLVAGLGVLCALKVITWQQALAAVPALLVPSIFGRKPDDDKKDPPAGGATPLIVGAMLCVLAACTPAALDAFRESTAEKAKCAIRNQSLSNADIIKKCLLEGSQADIERILALVGTAREEAAGAALVAAARQRDLDAKVGICRPEKTSSP